MPFTPRHLTDKAKRLWGREAQRQETRERDRKRERNEMATNAFQLIDDSVAANCQLKCGIN